MLTFTPWSPLPFYISLGISQYTVCTVSSVVSLAESTFLYLSHQRDEKVGVLGSSQMFCSQHQNAWLTITGAVLCLAVQAGCATNAYCHFLSKI